MIDSYKIKRNKEGIFLQILSALMLVHIQHSKTIEFFDDYNAQKLFFYHFYIISSYLSIDFDHRII
jgi:hypothetical protein